MLLSSPEQTSPSPGAARRIRVSRWSRVIDPLVGSDPGLNRLRTAGLAVVGIAAALGGEWLFVHLTGALQVAGAGAGLPAKQAALVAAQHHGVLVIAMLLGGIICMMSGFGVADVTARGQLVTSLIMPVALGVALTAGLAVGGHRLASLCLIAAAVTVGTYLRRFGPRGFVVGALLFIGCFMGFFIHAEIGVGDAGWLAAELFVGALCSLAVRFALFRPDSAKALLRAQRSWVARSRRLLDLAWRINEQPEAAGLERKIRRQLLRLNESVLMIDAQLTPAAVPGGRAVQALHERMFDMELALSNIARFAVALRSMDLPAGRRAMVGRILADLRRGDLAAAEMGARRLRRETQDSCVEPDDDRVAAVIPHRFAGSVIDLTVAQRDWLALGENVARPEPEQTFQPAVALFAGWLPGSAAVSADASLTSSRRRLGDRVAMAPYLRSAIQVGVAVSAAIAVGDVLSPRRFYWAVLAAFLAFMGTNHVGEQINKAFYRVLGTAVGIGLGSLVVRLVGHHTNVSIAVILVSLFVGLYLMRINYTFFVLGLTVMISQLYVQLDEYSGSLLLLRLKETAVGGGIAMVTVLLILPLRPSRVLRTATAQTLDAVRHLVTDALAVLVGPDGPDEASKAAVRSGARSVDASYQALVATARPVRPTSFGDHSDRIDSILELTGAARNYGRNLSVDLDAWPGARPALVPVIEQASAQLRRSLDALVERVELRTPGPYVRSAALFDRAERAVLAETAASVSPGAMVLRDLMLLDGTLARLADVLGMVIYDHDTALVGVAAGDGSADRDSPAAGPSGGGAGVTPA
ncbi:FUSC family protein [Acidiferrimicrobium sp. IK]|uniref:FUSC family protein n=1 Tax=Acidiferrimicrobium sp. IK TaxID=2871700 RepID=UPI0021CB24DA|nr:FUSC family protein [Acidiferrimicrobium sp. IK]MCU4185005.1 FUSC family protein [Acidiferrimicrobium sp. IK]